MNSKKIVESPNASLGKKAGFTLIEILVSSAILVVLGSGFLALQYVLGENRVTAWVSYQAIEDANRSLSLITKELRNATQSETGAYPLDTTSDQEIIFYTDYDFDSTVERVRYILSGTELIKGVVEPFGNPAIYDLDSEKTKILTTIIRNESDPVFYYYNADWPQDTINNPLIAADRIAETRHVKIILNSNPNPNLPDLEYKLESEVKIRMLGN